MTTQYCPNCKIRKQGNPPTCDCESDEWIPFFEFRWTYHCAKPNCSWSGDSHHDCGRHWRDEGHSEFEPVRAIQDRSSDPLPPDVDKPQTRGPDRA